jgi:hypothetical protein
MTRTCALCGATLYFDGERSCGVCDACFNDELAWYNVGEAVTNYDCSIDDPEFNEAEEGYIIA